MTRQQKYKIALFDAKSYDQKFFDLVNKDFGFEIDYFTPHLDKNTVRLAVNHDAVCVFVNDKITAKVVDSLCKANIQVIALRCAGYNNVDLKAVYGKIHVVRVPAYSPHAVAEHATALLLGLNRKTHRAYYRTHDGNFSIAGLLGFDLFEKTAGVVGTGKIGRFVVL